MSTLWIKINGEYMQYMEARLTEVFSRIAELEPGTEWRITMDFDEVILKEGVVE